MNIENCCYLGRVPELTEASWSAGAEPTGSSLLMTSVRSDLRKVNPGPSPNKSLPNAMNPETLDTSFGGALRFGGVVCPVHRTLQLTLRISSRPRHVWSASAATLNHPDQVSDCGQHASRARLTSWLATMHAWRCFFEATLRQPRADPHEFGPWLNLSVNARCLRIAASLP